MRVKVNVSTFRFGKLVIVTGLAFVVILVNFVFSVPANTDILTLFLTLEFPGSFVKGLYFFHTFKILTRSAGLWTFLKRCAVRVLAVGHLLRQNFRTV